MSTSPALKDLIKRIIVEKRVEGVIETGTYNGENSTKMLAESFAALSPKFFYTCEVELKHYRNARKNLAGYPFVQCLWGNSVRVEEALEFLKKDEALIQHEKFPDIFIDFIEDPLSFYLQECRGKQFGKRSLPYCFRYVLTKIKGEHCGEDLLRKLLIRHRDERPLIALDSAGGIGWLEFNIVQQIMRGKSYCLLLDDIHHLKHFRSFQQIQSDPSFQIIGYNPADGWALSCAIP